MGATGDGVDLFWLPLGAGGRLVRRTGRLYELWAARREHRQPQPLFHSALRIIVDGHASVVEMAPVWSLRVPDRGVVLEGPVGAMSLGRWRAFRYEVRCWPDGRIPDVSEAINSPVRVSEDVNVASTVLALASHVPALTWGRDELSTGDMWNSNSLIAYLLARAGLNATEICPPRGGRAPGWQAGIQLAARHQAAYVEVAVSA